MAFDTYTEKADQVRVLLAQWRIAYKVSLVGEVVRDKWTADQWLVRLNRGKGDVTFDYYTGTGRRSKPTKISPHGMPKIPEAADVLHCLVLDATALHQSFHDWCADLSYDVDSIKAFDTYRACCESATKLRQVFDRDQLAELNQILEGF